MNYCSLIDTVAHQAVTLNECKSMRHPKNENSEKGRLTWIISVPYKHTKGLIHNHVRSPRYLIISLSHLSIAHNLSPSNDKSPISQSQNTEPPDPQSQQAVVQRSRWQAVLLEAGGIGAAVSEESMRRLQYCLQWLQVCLVFFFHISHSCDFQPVRHIAYRCSDPHSQRFYCVPSTIQLFVQH